MGLRIGYLGSAVLRDQPWYSVLLRDHDLVGIKVRVLSILDLEHIQTHYMSFLLYCLLVPSLPPIRPRWHWLPNQKYRTWIFAWQLSAFVRLQWNAGGKRAPTLLSSPAFMKVQSFPSEHFPGTPQWTRIAVFTLHVQTLGLEVAPTDSGQSRRKGWQTSSSYFLGEPGWERTCLRLQRELKAPDNAKEILSAFQESLIRVDMKNQVALTQLFMIKCSILWKYFAGSKQSLLNLPFSLFM